MSGSKASTCFASRWPTASRNGSTGSMICFQEYSRLGIRAWRHRSANHFGISRKHVRRSLRLPSVQVKPLIGQRIAAPGVDIHTRHVIAIARQDAIARLFSVSVPAKLELSCCLMTNMRPTTANLATPPDLFQLRFIRLGLIPQFHGFESRKVAIFRVPTSRFTTGRAARPQPGRGPRPLATAGRQRLARGQGRGRPGADRRGQDADLRALVQPGQESRARPSTPCPPARWPTTSSRNGAPAAGTSASPRATWRKTSAPRCWSPRWRRRRTASSRATAPPCWSWTNTRCSATSTAA